MTVAPGIRHIVIDMQRLFAEDTPWHTPAVWDILPNVLELTRAFPNETIFAKFMLPPRIEDATGRWQNYYRRWSMLTTENIDPAIQDLVAPLQDMASAASIVEKTGYSVFSVPGFSERLIAEGVETLVFSGVETDVCVLGSVFDAIDAGFDVAVAIDAVGSSSPESHQATLDLVFPRLPDQLRLSTTADLIQSLSRR
ncbi:MAG: cysteine hydrolase [Rhizobium sp.]|nr:cysteine hydrolase [Rhizobium sp.]